MLDLWVWNRLRGRRRERVEGLLAGVHEAQLMKFPQRSPKLAAEILEIHKRRFHLLDYSGAAFRGSKLSYPTAGDWTQVCSVIEGELDRAD